MNEGDVGGVPMYPGAILESWSLTYEHGRLSGVKFHNNFWVMPENDLMLELAHICRVLLTEKDQ